MLAALTCPSSHDCKHGGHTKGVVHLQAVADRQAGRLQSRKLAAGKHDTPATPTAQQQQQHVATAGALQSPEMYQLSFT
jgi:hypothetical protein